MMSTHESDHSLAQAYSPAPLPPLSPTLREAALAILSQWKMEETSDAYLTQPPHSWEIAAFAPSDLPVPRQLITVSEPDLAELPLEARALELIFESPDLSYKPLLARLNPAQQVLYFSGAVDYLALADSLQELFTSPIQGGFGSKPNPELPGFEEGLLRKTSFSPDFRVFRLESPAGDDPVERLSHILFSLNRWLTALQEQGHSPDDLLSKLEFSLELTGDSVLNAVSVRTLRFLLFHWQKTRDILQPQPVFIHAYSHQSTTDWVLSHTQAYSFTSEPALVNQEEAPMDDLLNALAWVLAQQVWQDYSPEQW